MTIERDFDERFLAARQYLSNTLRKRFRRLSADEITDLVHDTYVRCRPNFAAVRNRDYFKSWLVSCAFNLAIQRFRKAATATRRRGDLVDLATARERLTAAKENPLERILKTERDAQILTVTDALPEKVREAFFLRFRDGLTFVKIARVQESVEPTVKTRVHRAIVELRGKIAA